MTAAVSLCFPPFAQSREQEPPKHEAEEPCEWQPLETGKIHSMHVLTRRRWKDQHSEGFVIAKETSRAEGELSTRWRGKTCRYKGAYGGVCSWGQTSVCHPLRTISRSGQPLITQRPANDADDHRYLERNRPSTERLPWQHSATPVRANHRAEGTMVYVAHTTADIAS